MPVPLKVCLLAGVAVHLAVGCSDGEADHGEIPDAQLTGAGDTCLRPQALAFDLGAEVVIADTMHTPCRLHVEEIGVSLLPDPDGVWPDPGPSVARDQRGRYYTANSQFPGVVAVWGSDGTFLRTIGRPGEGPGEFVGRGLLMLFIDTEDRLHVKGLNSTWSILSPTYDFLHQTRLGVFVGPPAAHLALLDGEKLVAARDIFTDRGNYFHIVDVRNGEHAGFGPVDQQIQESRARPERAVTRAGAASFWAAPASGDAQGYRLELWNTDGELLRTLRRDVEWFAPGGESSPDRPEDPPPPHVAFLHLDETGLLIVPVAVANDNWRWFDDARERARSEDLSNQIKWAWLFYDDGPEVVWMKP